MTQTRLGGMTAPAIGLALLIGAFPSAARAQAVAGGAAVAVDRARGQSVDELVALALRQSPDALAARARIDVAGSELAEAAQRPNPSASFERRDQVSGMDAQTSVGFTWPLDLFRRDGRVAVARAGVDAAEAAAAERRRQIEADVRLAVARLLASMRMLAVREDVAAANRRTLDLIAARVETGASPAIDRDVAAVESARSTADVHRQRAEVESEAAALRARLGLGPGQPLLLRDTLEDLAAQATETLAAGPLGDQRVEEAIAKRPDIRLADAEIARAIARRDLARREGRADVSLFAGYMRMRSGFPQLGMTPTGQVEPIEASFNNVAAGVMVMLPLRHRNQAAVAAAHAEAEAARHEREARRLDALNDADAWRRREAAAREAVAALGAGARGLASKNVDVLRESYQLGRATMLDVLAETRRLLDLEAAYNDAVLDLVAARVALHAALGGGR